MLKSTAVLAAAGFIAGRAHLHRLGIPAPAGMSTERHLSETWSMVWLSLEFLLEISLRVIPLGLALSAITLVLLRRLQRRGSGRAPSPTITRITAGVQAFRQSIWLPWLILLVLLGLIRSLWLPDLSSETSSVVIGPLDVKKLRPSMLEARLTYSFGVVTWLGAVWLVSVLGRGAQKGRPIWTVCRLALVAGTIALFLQYGADIHHTAYPTVELTLPDPKTQGPRSIKGLLIFDTGGELTVWLSSSREGRLLSLPRSTITSMAIGRSVDIREEALRISQEPLPPAPAQPQLAKPAPSLAQSPEEPHP